LPGLADSAARPIVRHAGAILTIFAAELGVSLDNVLGASAAASGNMLVLVLGLSAGMALVLVSGVQLARLLSRSAWLVVLAAGIVAWAGARLAVDDPVVLERSAPSQGLAWLVPAAILAAGLTRWWLAGREPKTRQRAAHAAGDPGTATAADG
jgi:predicted tellurium resistance membrane protein TerC